MAKFPKKIICVLTVLVIICAHVPVVHAEALPDVISGSSTIADIVMTYYAMGGSAVANPEWINTLYGSLGGTFGTIADFAENGMLLMNETGQWVASGGLEEAIANAPAYQSLGLDQVFNVSAEEVASGGGFVASTGAATLAGAAGAVGSTGIVPLLGGVTAAYWGGIGIGTMIAHLAGLYDKNVYYGLEVTTTKKYLDSIPAGGGAYNYKTFVNTYDIFAVDPGIAAYVYDTGNTSSGTPSYSFNFINVTDSTKHVILYKESGRNTVYNVGAGSRRTTNAAGPYIDGYVMVDHNLTLEEAKSMYENGDLTKPKHSPDIIGPEGNQVGEYDPQTQKYTVPDMLPQVDPGVQSGKPLSLEDWLNFANGVQNNNSQTNPIPDNQALFDNILDRIRQYIPGVTPPPETEPNPNPNPNPGGDPYSPPIVTPVPDPNYPNPVPDQPTSENPQESEKPSESENPDESENPSESENPDESENPSESENPQESEKPLDPVDTGKPWMLPDLTKKFPFCIPWDIKDCFTLLKSNIRQAPYISWRFNPPNTPVDYTFNLDLSDFEPVATLLRTLELIAFIAGLAFATRYLIGAS